MSITIANWNDLGYSKIGPSARKDEAKTELYKKMIDQFGSMDYIKDQNVLWARDKGLSKKNDFRGILKEIALVDHDTFGEMDFEKLLREYSLSKYSKKKDDSISQEWNDSLKSLEHINDEDLHRGVYSFASAIFCCKTSLLPKLLSEYALPKFFTRFPFGRVLIHEVNYDYQIRSSFQRVGYAFEQFPITEFAPPFDGIRSLQEFSTSETLQQSRRIIELCLHCFYPQVYGFTASPMGLIFSFIFDKPESHTLQPFPSSWISNIQSAADNGGEVGWDDTVLQNPLSDESRKKAHKRLVQNTTFSAEEMTSFVRDIVSHYNRIAFHQSNIGNYQTDEFVDFTLGFEHGVTFDRILNRGITSVFSEGLEIRQENLFEMADLIESLNRLHTGSPSTDTFKNLFNTKVGSRLIAHALTDLIEPFRSHFTTLSADIYHENEKVILDSIWVKSRRTAGEVIVKRRDLLTDYPESNDEFVSNVMRSIRNTHHGFISRTDPSNRPSRYLSIISGRLPDSLSYLGIIWLFALLCDSKTLIGWSPQEIGSFD